MPSSPPKATARHVVVIGACTLAVIGAAAVQHTVVLGMALQPHMFVVPTVVGIVFGSLIVWSLGLLTTNQAYARELEEREGEILAINRDLEARIAQQTQELAQRQEELLQSQKLEMIGHLAGGLAHDLNNLLTVVLSNASLLEDSTFDEQRQMAREIVDACGKGADLTRQLLEKSRAREVEPSSLSMSDTVDRLAPLLMRALGQRFDIRVSHQDAPEVVAVPSQIDQVLLNLVLNARDAMPEGGVLELGTHPCERDNQPGTCLVVRDTGTGISPDVATRLFEPFFSTKGADKGTGLGLPTVRRVVRAWGGHIRFDTSQEGTTFEVWIPSAAPLTATPPAAERRDTDQPVILLVEDEAPIRALLERLLADEPVELLTATNVEQAMQTARSAKHIDLLVSDLDLHDRSGQQLWSQLAELHPGVAAVFTSDRADAAEGTTCIAKPYDAATMVSAVREATGISA